MTTETTLERFIIDELLLGYGKSSIAPDEPLVSSRLLDSLSLIRLILFVEEEFGVKIDDHEVVPDNFETIDLITAIVESKRPAGSEVSVTQEGRESDP